MKPKVYTGVSDWHGERKAYLEPYTCVFLDVRLILLNVTSN